MHCDRVGIFHDERGQTSLEICPGRSRSAVERIAQIYNPAKIAVTIYPRQTRVYIVSIGIRAKIRVVVTPDVLIASTVVAARLSRFIKSGNRMIAHELADQSIRALGSIQFYKGSRAKNIAI